MTNQLNTLLTTEWLLPIFNEQFENLHNRWAQATTPQEFAEFVDHYYQLSATFKVANLPIFASLTQTLAFFSQAIVTQKIAVEYAMTVLYASELLLYELNSYVQTGDYHSQLLLKRQTYLQQVLRNLNIDMSQLQTDEVIDFQAIDAILQSQEEHNSQYEAERLIECITVPKDEDTKTLTETQFATLSKVWRHSIQGLLVNNTNDKKALNKLQQVTQYLKSDATAHNLSMNIGVWYFVYLWLGSLALNDTPKPRNYAHSLADLDQIIGATAIDRQQPSQISALSIDIYLQIKRLSKVLPEADTILDSIDSHAHNEQAFLPRLLQKLEKLIFQLDNPDTLICPLQNIQLQLSRRGWHSYEKQVEHVVQDLRLVRESPEIYKQLRWQIERQLQELYGAIFKSFEVITSEIGQTSPLAQQGKTSDTDDTNDHNSDTNAHLDEGKIRKVRIAVEDIKIAFNSYLYSHSFDNLPETEDFDTLHQMFTTMALYDAVNVTEQCHQVFLDIKDYELTHLSWTLTDSIAEGLALLELFLDYLAQQTIDLELLQKSLQKFDSAQDSLVKLSQSPEDVQEMAVDMDMDIDVDLSFGNEVTRYSDDGEIVATAYESEVSKTGNLQETIVKTPIDEVQSENNTEPDDITIIDTNDNSENNKNTQTVTSDDTPELKEIRATLTSDSFDMDSEIHEIFIEEAQEVLEDLDIYLPAWQNDRKDLTPLSEIRRGFHTLKGSGRMVGAHSVGELAWSVENLLNRVLDQTLEVTNELVQFINETKTLIPILVADFAKRRLPSIDPAITILKTENLLSNRPINQGLPEPINVEQDIAIPDTAKLVNEKHSNTAYDFEVDKVAKEVLQPIVKMTEADDISDGSNNNTHNNTDNDTDNDTDSSKETDNSEMTSSTENSLPNVLIPFMEDTTVPEDDDSVDEDIKDIFIEEAIEVLEEITPILHSWSNDSSQIKLLKEVRRGFHTLKGSGRMVGAYYTAELAWAIENMLNRILDSSIEITSSIKALLKDVLQAYPAMITVFELGECDYPVIIPVWIACANAYSKGLGDEFDYDKIKQSFATVDFEPTGGHDTNELTTPVEADNGSLADVDMPRDDVLSSLESANERMADAKHPMPSLLEEEQAFYDIFLEEVDDLIKVIHNFIDSNCDKKKIAVDDEVVRAFHTLRGAAGSSSLKAISDIGTTVEHSLKILQQHEEPLNLSHLKAIEQSVVLIENYVKDFKNDEREDYSGYADTDTDNSELEYKERSGNSSQQHIEALQELFDASIDKQQFIDYEFNVSDIVSHDIDDLLNAEWELKERLTRGDRQEVSLYAEVIAAQIEKLLGKVTGSVKFVRILTALHAVYEQVEQNPELSKQQRTIDFLFAGQQALIGLLDALAASMTLHLNEEVVANLGKIAKPTDVELLLARSNIQTVKKLDIEPIDTDIELLEIFLEEAQELDNSIHATFDEWRKTPTDSSILSELQRHLHTIKGGARMAGISSIGDLTHEAETIYELFSKGKLIPDGNWIDMMQSVQDVLSQQIDYILATHSSFYAIGLVEQLKEFAQLKKLPETLILDIPYVTEHEVKSQDHSINVEEVETGIDIAIDNLKLTDLQVSSWNNELPDKDILTVFLEEAEELVESSSEHLKTFRSNTSDLTVLQNLQRELHTMKGGARMVGANGVADLSHHMETVYEDLSSRRRPATKLIGELLESCHDWLVNAIHILNHRVNPPTPTKFIEALKNFSKNPDSLQVIPKESLQSYQEAIDKYGVIQFTSSGQRDISIVPPMMGSFEKPQDQSTLNHEMIRIPTGLMEQMINLSGESAINRARIDMGVTSLTNTIEEMGVTVQRLADQLRRMDIELEAQILAQIDDEKILEAEGFDPLEMDQYSSLNQLSKSLSESASDLLDIKTTMLDKTRDAEGLLLQLSRTQTELQDGLMNSRMVPFSRLTPRLQRIVRQTANELNKSVELKIINADDEMDRTILERITSPLEHMLRNAVDHGIEPTAVREQLGKPRVGRIVLEVLREGSEIVLHLSDDGSGINVEAVRKKAIQQGLIDPNDTSLSDLDVMQYIFNAGLTTTKTVTQISGRGVGMDVVLSEIRQLGGIVSVESKEDGGSRFSIRVPLTVAISDALVVRAGERYYAVPLVQIERVLRVNPEQIYDYYRSGNTIFEIDGTDYRLRYLNEMINGTGFNELSVRANISLPVIVVKNQTGQQLAIQVDEVAGSRIEVVVKPLGRQLSHAPGISAATIMGDGSVMLILDLLALMRNAPMYTHDKVSKQGMVDVRGRSHKDKDTRSKQPSILIVDDSVTVRKVTSRLLERQGFETHVAKDGIDAIEVLQDLTPDIMLLDIEMPRMDGFEVAMQVRHDSRLQDIPIIMITSRTGDKHRERALEIGVNEYMGKPYQEAQLLQAVKELLGQNVHD